MARDETSTVLMTVAWLAGCTVGPDYKRPEVLMPADWRHGPEGRDSLCDLGWCELFKDPALHELISTAVVANRDLQVLGAARAAQFPRSMPAPATHDPRGHRALEAERRTDGYHPFAGPDARRLSQSYRGQFLGVDLDHRHVGFRVLSEHSRVELGDGR
jgi:hypothetical protein